MQIKNFDRANLRVIREKLLAAINKGLQEIDPTLSAELGGMGFQDDKFTVKVTGRTGIQERKVEDNTTLTCGLALRGAKAMAFNRSVTILKAKRARYDFSFDDTPGKIFNAPFHCFTLPANSTLVPA